MGISSARGLGVWDTTKVKDTVYLAATDLIVQASANTAQPVEIFSDGANPPTVSRAKAGIGSNEGCAVASLVENGHYYKVTHAGTPNIQVKPIFS